MHPTPCLPHPPTPNASVAASTPKQQSPAPTAASLAQAKKKPSEKNRLMRGIERFDADTRAKMVLLYYDGVSSANLAIRYGVSSDWLRRVFYPAMGIKPATRSKAWENVS